MEASGLSNQLGSRWWKWAQLAEAQGTCGMQLLGLTSSAFAVYTTDLAGLSQAIHEES